MLISLPIAEWLEWHAGKQGVAGSIPGGGIYYHFEIFANGTLFTSRRRPYKWNQAWHSSKVMGGQEIDLILKQIWRQFIWRQVSFNTSSMKIFILSTTLLYTNQAKVSTDSAKNGNFSVFWIKYTNFVVKYLTNWWQDKKIDCHAMKWRVLRYKIGCYFSSLEKKNLNRRKKGPI